MPRSLTTRLQGGGSFFPQEQLTADGRSLRSLLPQVAQNDVSCNGLSTGIFPWSGHFLCSLVSLSTSSCNLLFQNLGITPIHTSSVFAYEHVSLSLFLTPGAFILPRRESDPRENVSPHALTTALLVILFDVP